MKNPHVVVKSIPSDSLTDSLGINADRSKQLQFYVFMALGTSPSITVAMAMVSAECDSANELAFVCYILGQHLAQIDEQTDERSKGSRAPDHRLN
jgi:hypothetical protein